jgi:hypothetical protein
MKLSTLSVLKHPWFAHISLLTAAMLTMAWVATDHHTWLASAVWSGRYHAVRLDAGRICLEKLATDVRAMPRQGGWDFVFPDHSRDSICLIPEDRNLSNGFGFKYWTWNLKFPGSPNSISFARLTIPFWLLIAVFLIAPGLFLVRYLKSRMRRARQACGLCVHCGYDLRATKELCPECGRPAQVTEEK